MAYASVISLKQTLERLRSQPRIILVPESQTDVMYEDACYLEMLPYISKAVFGAFGGQIKELAEQLEDLLDSHVSDQFLSSQSSSGRDESLTVIFSHSLLQVMQEFDSFTKAMKTHTLTTEDHDKQQPTTSFSASDVVSSRIDDFGGRVEMVGMDPYVQSIRDWLTKETRLTVMAFVGMAGIGKTALAKKILQDPLVADKYTRVCLPIGPQYQFKKCLLLALDQAGYSIDEVMCCEKEDRELAECLCGVLSNGTYLVVLDDVWDVRVWDDFKPCFPDNNNCSRIILTTRLKSIVLSEHYVDIPFLKDDASWDLLRKTVFTADEEESSYRHDHQLEKLGRKIAANCEGLPLAIIEIGKLLRKADKTVDYWKKVAEDDNPLNIRADDDTPISKTLSLSYDNLPLYLKVCFLYMGVFPKGYDATHSKLTKLWISEGFIDLQISKDVNISLEEMVDAYISQIFLNCLVIPSAPSSKLRGKSYRVHFLYRAFCVSKASNENFFHVINKYANSFPQSINSQRRLCIHNKALFSFKQVQSSMESVSGARSLLFFGQKDQQPLRVYLGYRLLKILDALTVRFYEFPLQVVELFHLRYLAITYGGREIPPSISRLWNLEILIVRPHHHFIKYPDDPIYLPAEIWKLRRLKHLECVGFDLPHPSSIEDEYNSLGLEQLLTLSGVSDCSCTKAILERLPNLLKLGIRITRGLMLDYAAETSFDFFGDVTGACGRIKSFNCVVLKPDHGSRIVSSIPDFHVNIRKINLSGCGIRWDYMGHIGSLPNLKVLKLRLYAFRGPEWETVEGGFPQLESLLLEDLDLEHWRTVGVGHFPSLVQLSVIHCYKLREIPCEIGDIPTLKLIRVTGCSRRAYQRLWENVESKRLRNVFPQFWHHSSSDDEKLE